MYDFLNNVEHIFCLYFCLAAVLRTENRGSEIRLWELAVSTWITDNAFHRTDLTDSARDICAHRDTLSFLLSSSLPPLPNNFAVTSRDITVKRYPALVRRPSAQFERVHKLNMDL